ncbi:MAG: MFS transporter [Planctomycetota bacterium]|nr:MFS transporter [Planctomycetota bacterium]
MIGVLKNNPQFRKLWFAQVVSAIGDWLNRIATLVLIGELGADDAQLGVGIMYAVEYSLRLLPTAAFSPLAGPIADRLSRRAIMIASDFARAAVVLCLLLIHDPEHLHYLYGIIFVQMSLGIFFESARSGALPNTVSKDDLHEAYSLSAATWSTMLAVGGFLGGVLVVVIGTDGVFIVDAATYLLSAAFLWGLRLPDVPKQKERFRLLDVLLFRDLRRGFTHVRNLGIAPILLSKVLWSPCGGYVILFPMIAKRYETGEVSLQDTGTAIGLLFAARGVGTGLGPILARHLGGSSEAALIRQTWGGMLLGSVGYLFLPLAPSLAVATLCVTVAHMGGSAQWVGSTTYWQRRIDDAFRGRVFATEFLLMTLSFSVFALLSGFLYDRTGDMDLVIWILVALTTSGGLIARKLFARLPRGNAA